MIKQEGLNKEDKQFATKVMVWYLVNLLLLPVIGFVMQVILYRGLAAPVIFMATEKRMRR